MTFKAFLLYGLSECSLMCNVWWLKSSFLMWILNDVFFTWVSKASFNLVIHFLFQVCFIQYAQTAIASVVSRPFLKPNWSFLWVNTIFELIAASQWLYLMRMCVDVDECSDKTAVCDPHADCINVPGSYQCRCQCGYQGDGKRCRRTLYISLSLSLFHTVSK